MNIHEYIRTRREQLGLSKTELAKRVSEIQPDEPITRQTVQHWESGNSAPKRERMVAVARALETTVGLMNRDELLDPVNDLSPEGRQALQLLDMLKEIQAMDPHRFARLASNITELVTALRATDQILSTTQGGTSAPASPLDKLAQLKEKRGIRPRVVARPKQKRRGSDAA